MSNSPEIWKPFPIKPWDEAFEISNWGRIRYMPRIIRDRPVSGYRQVTLKRRGAESTIRVHRAVALAFLGPHPEGKSSVNHKDFNKANNSVENLEWCSPAENSEHAKKAGRMRAANLKIDRDKVAELYNEGYSLTYISKHQNVTVQAISQFLKRQGLKYKKHE